MRLSCLLPPASYVLIPRYFCRPTGFIISLLELTPRRPHGNQAFFLFQPHRGYPYRVRVDRRHSCYRAADDRAVQRYYLHPDDDYDGHEDGQGSKKSRAKTTSRKDGEGAWPYCRSENADESPSAGSAQTDASHQERFFTQPRAETGQVQGDAQGRHGKARCSSYSRTARKDATPARRARRR